MTSKRVSKEIQFKNKNDLEQFKKREAHTVDGTLKIVLGKIKDNFQQIWYQDHRNCPIQQLRELHSNETAFEYACLIVKACHKLSSLYGNFLLNENMVFKTIETQKLFIWLNPDFFCNQIKIFLPQNNEGQLSMIKGLLNYFKLWLHTDYCCLSQAKNLQELQFKISSSKKKKNSSSNANSTKVQSQYFGDNKNSNSTSKNIDQKFSYRPKHIGKFSPSIKGSEPSQVSKSINNKIQFKHIFNTHGSKNPGLSSKHSESGYQKYDDFPDANKPMTAVSRTTGNAKNNKLYPSKTTSVTSNRLLQLIKNADRNPDEYVPNNIKVDAAKLEEQQKLIKGMKTKTCLGEVGEELDNLFLSNMEEEEEDDHEAYQREKQFETLLD